jgi:crossover junction endodeoxyribonuclease RuvC
VRPAPLGERILGIDPGLNRTGYGVLERTGPGPKLCEAGLVRARPAGSLASRIHEIHAGVADVIAGLQPAVMALEQLYSHYQRPRTAILMGHARGAICLAAAQAGIPVVHYAATQVKKLLTGAGRAPKWQVARAVQRELQLRHLPEPFDVADALAIAICHYHAGRSGLGRDAAGPVPSRAGLKGLTQPAPPRNATTGRRPCQGR